MRTCGLGIQVSASSCKPAYFYLKAVFSKVSNVSRLTSLEAKRNMEYRIRELRMFTPERRCDGAGTVITDNPAAGNFV